MLRLKIAIVAYRSYVSQCCDSALDGLNQSQWQESRPHWYARPLGEFFHQVFEMTCSKVEDKISIALNVSGIQLRYFKNDISDDFCRWSPSLLALAGGDATVLGSDGDTVSFGDNSEHESWLHWPDSIQRGINIGLVAKVPEDLWITEIDYDHVTLDLLVVSRGTARMPSIASLEKAETFVNACISQQKFYDHSDDHMWRLDHKHPEFQQQKLVSIQSMACYLECGLDWMISNGLMSQKLNGRIEASGRIEAGGSGEALPLVSIAMTALFGESSLDFQILSVDAERKSLLNEFLVHVMYTGHPVVGTVVPWLSNSEALAKAASQFIKYHDLGSAGKALFMSTKPLNMNDELLYAIPVALADSNCALVSRLWLLERVGSMHTGGWRIVRKCDFFTYSPLKDNGTTVVRWSNQRVQGSGRTEEGGLGRSEQ